ncbi:unnamed protein product, partial [Dovyalis caffra]
REVLDTNIKTYSGNYQLASNNINLHLLLVHIRPNNPLSLRLGEKERRNGEREEESEYYKGANAINDPMIDKRIGIIRSIEKGERKMLGKEAQGIEREGDRGIERILPYGKDDSSS